MYDENKHAYIYAHKMISRRSKVTFITYESNGNKSIHLDSTSNLKIVFGLKIYTVLKNKQEEEEKFIELWAFKARRANLINWYEIKTQEKVQMMIKRL